MIKSNRGQLSIFMGVCLILVMGMMAFVVNVGLFVKAKINLQNAVDAAAYSGAAVQARQLTNIGYLNWEMRNTYKEWMYKYYIIGQLSLFQKNYDFQEFLCNGANKSSFLLYKANYDNSGHDLFNVPSICIHNKASTTNICPVYSLPGVPRFPSVGVAGISEIFESFVTELVQKKAEDCSYRTKLNYLTAISWTFNSGLNGPIPDAPEIAANRPGAWLQSIELAFRMRNLEMIVNRPPVANMTFQMMESLRASDDIGLNERPVKAFMSAFRNLSGGKYKSDLTNDEFASSFTLTEISPTPYSAAPGTVSSFLIPKTGAYSEGISFTEKHYLDLQAVPVNLATFYTTFVPDSNAISASGSTVAAEAACLSSKTALPVPGYILGFTKNPEVLTYYAVKGEAEFTGLFFPFGDTGDSRSIKLTAYAAAKPFGGRIGPRLFDFRNGGETLFPRGDRDSKSQPYVSTIYLGLLSGNFRPGLPIPSDQSFWVNPSDNLGGTPKNSDVKFGIPNLIYDAQTLSDLVDQSTSGSNSAIQQISARMTGIDCGEAKYGLYNKNQINYLSQNLTETLNGQSLQMINEKILDDSIIAARQVTKYDSLNYLIPDVLTPSTSSNRNVYPTAEFVESLSSPAGAVRYKLYAPLMGPQLMYQNISSIEEEIRTYIQSNEIAVDKYLAAIYDVAYGIATLKNAPASKGTDLIDSARSIHINVTATNPSGPTIPPPLNDATCADDLASRFNHFFKSESTACNNVPLKVMVTDYIQKRNNSDSMFYHSTYMNRLQNSQYMSGFAPGPRQGASSTLEHLNPIGAAPAGSDSFSLQRNFYSTKLVPLHKLTTSTSPDQNYSQGTLRETLDEKSPSDLLEGSSATSLKNLINRSANALDHSYFGDF